MRWAKGWTLRTLRTISGPIPAAKSFVDPRLRGLQSRASKKKPPKGGTTNKSVRFGYCSKCPKCRGLDSEVDRRRVSRLSQAAPRLVEPHAFFVFVMKHAIGQRCQSPSCKQID